MEIRQLTTEEIELHLRLSEFAFQYELSDEERLDATKKIKPEQIWGIFIDGQLASKMVILPLEAYIHGKPYAMGGIASVATWPEYRRKGLVAKLLTHSLEVMRDEGQTISFLAPFSFPFYRKYGWEIHSEYKQWKINVEELPRVKGKGKVERITREDEVIHQVYEQYASVYNGTLKRTPEWWSNRVFSKRKKGVVALYRDEQGQAKGYLFYDVRDNQMSIHEMVYLDHDSYLGLWEFIRQHDSMIKEVKLKTPVQDPLPLIVDNPELEQQAIPYFMVRIVDVQRFLEIFPLNWSQENDHTFIHIRDPHAPWNDGTFHIKARVQGEAVGNNEYETKNEITFFPRKREEISCTNLPRKGLSCDIQTLSTMLIGYQRPGTLYRLEKLQGEYHELELWEKLLPPGRSYLMDFF